MGFNFSLSRSCSALKRWISTWRLYDFPQLANSFEWFFAGNSDHKRRTSSMRFSRLCLEALEDRSLLSVAGGLENPFAAVFQLQSQILEGPFADQSVYAASGASPSLSDAQTGAAAGAPGTGSGDAVSASSSGSESSFSSAIPDQAYADLFAAALQTGSNVPGTDGTQSSIAPSGPSLAPPPPSPGPGPEVSIAATVAQTVEGIPSAPGLFTVSRSNSSGALTVNFSFSGTATNLADYHLTPTSSVAFADGQSSAVIAVEPHDDTQTEGSETVVVTLQPGVGYLLGASSSGTFNLIDAPGQSTVTIEATDYFASESPLDSALFTVRRTGSTSTNLEVFYGINGTALAGRDFTALCGSVTIPVGFSSAAIPLQPLDDGWAEEPETVILNLIPSAAYNSQPGSSATAMIAADLGDTGNVVTVAATDGGATEDAADAGVFTFSRRGSTASALTVSFGIGGTAVPNTDYTSLPTSVTIPAGSSSVTLAVNPIDDVWEEDGETVVVSLNSGIGFEVGLDDTAAVIITDGNIDTGPQVSILVTQPVAFETDESPSEFTFYRSGDTSNALTVSYTVSGTATPVADYSPPSGSAVFAAGSNIATLEVVPLDDFTAEPGETVIVSLVGSSGYGLGYASDGTVTIVDNDSVVTVVATDPNAGEAGQDAGVFTVSRTGDLSAELTVSYAVGGTADGSLDYAPLSGLIAIPAGSASTTIAVSPIDDTLQEGTETVEVTLLWGSNYAMGGSPANVLIADDLADNGPQINIAATDPFANEDTLDPAAFTVTRTGSFAADLTVFYTVSGTALSPEDYAPLSASVTIQAGASSTTIPVNPVNDELAEGQETVVVALTASATYQVSQFGSALAYLADGPADQQPSITILDATKANALRDLRVAKWQGSFKGVSRILVAPPADIFGGDPDRFHIRVKDPGKVGQASITIAVSTDSPGTDYDDGATQITLPLVAGTQDVFETPTAKSLVLVSNAADNAHKVDNVANNDPGDRSHIVALGGQVKVTYGQKTATANVPVRKRVAVNTYILTRNDNVPLIGEPFVDYDSNGFRSGAGVGEPYWDVNGDGQYTPYLSLQWARIRVDRDLKIANETYAQVGVLLESVPVFVTVPAKISNLNGLVNLSVPPVQGENALYSPGEKDLLLAGYNSRATDDIEVYYVSRLYRPKAVRGAQYTQATSFISTGYRNMTKGDVNDSTAIADNSTLYTLPHELLHILTQQGHDNKLPEVNLMTAPATNIVVEQHTTPRLGASFSDTKRLSLAQDADIEKSKYGKKP